ncbi:hypothetical protein CN503_32215 [Bacillus cereus]|nr:hypothetical protein CON43_15620 [Bacillus cereus]RGP98245.1 hypothetical protein D1166_20050 [Bacillus sp. ISO11]PER53899.1 hypothetical protein CN503_32215 [Bacillus cereus]PES08916.1 hypothetical protein CN501_25720 [Bacillus cereus]PES31014.1 hypothetical protein CN496_07465 [Bacillus cereus]
MYVTVLFSAFIDSAFLSKEMWGFVLLIILISILFPYIFNILTFARNRWTKLVYFKFCFEQILDERESE